MSRIGKLPIKIPEGVNVTIDQSTANVSGPLGKLQLDVNNAVEVVVLDGEVRVVLKDSESSNIHGLTRSLLANMIKGVSQGWDKTLELSGTGFRATTTGTELQLALGFSHPVKVTAPEGVKFEVKENKITVSGRDKIIVGEVAAKIRGLKPADPYKLKGLKYEGEVIIKKAGKAAKAGA